MDSAEGTKSVYDFAFYGSNEEAVFVSPRVIVPIVCRLFHPQNVVDVGCGTGVWLSVFLENGVQSILGLDGSHVNQDWLKIPRNCFRPADLSSNFELKERFDLAVCLEVAEHLPARSADHLIETLTSVAPVVLFSAAVPGQGGTEHVNEQWPEYWHDKFANCGFLKLDIIRKEIWLNPFVKYWYRQNTYVYMKRQLFQTDRFFLSAGDFATDLMLIHRDVFTAHFRLRRLLRRLPSAFREFIVNQWGKIRGRAS
jgi:SAM-dependent methyltransferase